MNIGEKIRKIFPLRILLIAMKSSPAKPKPMMTKLCCAWNTRLPNSVLWLFSDTCWAVRSFIIISLSTETEGINIEGSQLQPSWSISVKEIPPNLWTLFRRSNKYSPNIVATFYSQRFLDLVWMKSLILLRTRFKVWCASVFNWKLQLVSSIN